MTLRGWIDWLVGPELSLPEPVPWCTLVIPGLEKELLKTAQCLAHLVIPATFVSQKWWGPRGVTPPSWPLPCLYWEIHKYRELNGSSLRLSSCVGLISSCSLGSFRSATVLFQRLSHGWVTGLAFSALQLAAFLSRIENARMYHSYKLLPMKLLYTLSDI